MTPLASFCALSISVLTLTLCACSKATPFQDMETNACAEKLSEAKHYLDAPSPELQKHIDSWGHKILVEHILSGPDNIRKPNSKLHEMQKQERADDRASYINVRQQDRELKLPYLARLAKLEAIIMDRALPENYIAARAMIDIRKGKPNGNLYDNQSFEYSVSDVEDCMNRLPPQ